MVLPRFVCCFDTLCLETPAVSRVESLVVPILIYCWSVLLCKFFNTKCLVLPSCVHELFLVMVSGITRQQRPRKGTMLCTHTAAGRGPEQAGASKRISLPLTLAEPGMADVERAE